MPDKPNPHSPEAVKYAFDKAIELLIAAGFFETAAILGDCRIESLFATPPAPVRAAADPGEMREAIIEECAKHIEHQADVATNSLHCGDNSQTIAATHRVSRAYYEAAKSIRALCAALSPASANEGSGG